MGTLNRTQAIPLNNYADGTYQLPETNFPNNGRFFYFELKRCTTADPTIWPNEATRIDISLEFSDDNGATWRGIGGFTALGGIHVKRDGTEALVTSGTTTDLGTGNQRKIRGKAIVSGGPLRTEGFFEARD